MPVVQNLYQIFKLPASMIVANDCKIDNYTITKGLKEGNIVSIGDNLVFQQLRYIHGNYKDHRELFNYIQKCRKSAHEYKKQGEYKKAKVLERYITETLFVEDIVNVVVDGKKSDFNKFRVKGFDLNGKHYIYLCSGSGQIRRNTATFVTEEYREQIVKTLNCGLDEKTSQFVLAKYSAYFALSFSSILWVRTPRVCVVKDFFRTLKDQKVDFIYHDAADGDKAKIEERTMDLELNCADGQGIIDPYFAQLWSEDMDLPYVPCSFVARSCFIKGNLVPFDFKEYAHQHGIFKIRDKWGTEYNIDDIDVLLSESQFKTHKYYSSWQDYCSYAEKGNIHWGVARYSKRVDPEYILTNYQYIQSLELSEQDIHELIQPTVDWIQKVCSGDQLASLLYAFGVKNDDADYRRLLGTAQTTPMKAIVKNIDFLKDAYVQRKIYKNIVESINHAKLGKIWVRGNYQFCIADPLAQVQAALGLPATGCLGANQVWSKFWVDRGVSKIDICRSPMIDVHEHNPNDIHTDADIEYWFRYIYSGIIYNTYDTSCFRQEDSDYDGDIVLSTDNPYFIKGSHKDHNIITYDKGGATPGKMNIPNITATVMKGFGTGVGGFSNTATIMYAMAAIFKTPGHEDQYAELMRRIKLLREIVGQEIDRIKGADKPSLPTEWRKFQTIDPDDTPEQATAKYRTNAMVVSKKPYFFRYLYPELNQRFKQFEDSYNQISRDMFGIKFKQLLKKEDKTEEEKNFVRRYQKYCPLITSPCTMNRLCREFESVNFDIAYHDKNTTSLLPTYEAYYASTYDKTKYQAIRKMYTSYSNRKQIKNLTALLLTPSVPVDSDDYAEIRSTIYDAIITDIQNQLEALSISGDEFLFYCHRLSKDYASFNWGFAWEILDDQILKYIPQGTSLCPVRDPENGFEYLGDRYSLKDITDTTEIALQKLITALFGDSETAAAEAEEIFSDALARTATNEEENN